MPGHGDGMVAYELRDGVLQDLVAVGLLLEQARRALQGGACATEVEAILDRAQATVGTDLRSLRGIIDRLRIAA